MSQNQSHNINASSSIINFTAKLRSAGKNWKEWHKQLAKAAVAMNALSVLDGPQPQPPYDSNDIAYTLLELSYSITKPNMKREQIT
jgi:hypothetical protein